MDSSIYNLCGVKDNRAWDLFYDIICLDAVTTRHFSQFQLMWPHGRCRSSHFREWWEAFRSYKGQMINKDCNQINSWGWDSPRAVRDQVDRSDPQTTSSGKVNRTRVHFSLYGCDDLRGEMQSPKCQHYKRGDFLAVRPLTCDEIIHEDDDDEHWVNPRAPSGGRSHLGDGIDNDHSAGEKDMQGSEKGTGNGKETNDE